MNFLRNGNVDLEKAHLIIGDVVLGPIRLTSCWEVSQECLLAGFLAYNLAALCGLQSSLTHIQS